MTSVVLQLLLSLLVTFFPKRCILLFGQTFYRRFTSRFLLLFRQFYGLKCGDGCTGSSRHLAHFDVILIIIVDSHPEYLLVCHGYSITPFPRLAHDVGTALIQILVFFCVGLGEQFVSPSTSVKMILITSLKVLFSIIALQITP